MREQIRVAEMSCITFRNIIDGNFLFGKRAVTIFCGEHLAWVADILRIFQISRIQYFQLAVSAAGRAGVAAVSVEIVHGG